MFLPTLVRLITVSAFQLIYILLLTILESVEVDMDMDGCSQEEGIFVLFLLLIFCNGYE